MKRFILDANSWALMVSGDSNGCDAGLNPHHSRASSLRKEFLRRLVLGEEITFTYHLLLDLRIMAGLWNLEKHYRVVRSSIGTLEKERLADCILLVQRIVSADPRTLLLRILERGLLGRHDQIVANLHALAAMDRVRGIRGGEELSLFLERFLSNPWLSGLVAHNRMVHGLSDQEQEERIALFQQRVAEFQELTFAEPKDLNWSVRMEFLREDCMAAEDSVSPRVWAPLEILMVADCENVRVVGNNADLRMLELLIQLSPGFIDGGEWPLDDGIIFDE